MLLVSDSSGHLSLQRHFKGLKGLLDFTQRPVDTLMERVQQGTQADLTARRRSGMLRGLMYLNIKAGLDGGALKPLSQEFIKGREPVLSPLGVRWDFLTALIDLRTDLNAFSEVESHALMACGYQMAKGAFERDLRDLENLWDEPAPTVQWPFDEMLREITSIAGATPQRQSLINELRRGR